jgi:hypothetical protein
MKCIMKKILIAFLLLTVKLGFSQTAVTNTGVLYVSQSSDILYTGSDFTNNAGATFTNKGQFHVRGNLTNNETGMAVGTGTLYLNGSTAQAVNGGQAFKTQNFVSNNVAGITLNNNLNISGFHTFITGIIATSATPNYLVYEAGSSYMGDGDAAHVSGWVKKFGGTNFIFPVGNGTVERTVAISNLSASSEFNARYLAITPNPTLLQLPLRSVDPYEYWPLTRTSGGTAQVTLNWDRSKVYFPNYILPDLAVAGWSGTLWVDNGGTAVGNAATTGTITSNAISTFNLFTFGSRSYVLPLSLTSFTANKNVNNVLIEWTTEKEINLSHFVVERSDDGTSFYSIGHVSGSNSGKTESYQLIDNKPVQNIAYYRLRSVDLDGKQSLSRIATVMSAQANDRLMLVNNPAHNKITLLATGTLSGEFNYQLILINGQVIKSGKLSIQNGGYYDISLDGNVKAGTYSLKLSDNKQAYYYKVLVL